MQEIVELRKRKQFFDFEDFIQTVAEEKEKRRQKLQLGERLKSPINRRVIIHLIIAGAFDELEKIQAPHQRWDILTKYFMMLHPELKQDPLQLNEKLWIKRMGAFFEYKDYEDYAWTLKQKALCGYGNIDFDELLYDLSYKNRGLYKENNHILHVSEPGEKVIVGGVVE